MTAPSPAARARRRQRVEELAGAVVRAQAADPSLHFRAGRLYAAETPFPATAPHLAGIGDLDPAAARGVADGLALRRRHSDPGVHARLAPEPAVARVVFEMLEQFRVESLAELPGVRSNLRERHRDWSARCLGSGVTQTATGALLHALALVCRAQVTRQPMPPDAVDAIESTRFALAPVIGHDLARLRVLRENQRAYAGPARAIAAVAADLVAAETVAAGPHGETGRVLASFSLLAGGEDDEPAVAVRRGGRSEAAPAGAYRVFTRAHDQQLDSAALVRPAQLAEMRARLDRRVADQGVNLPRLAERLREALARPERDGWDDGQEEGLIDGRRLAQMIAAPDQRRVFRTERRCPVVTAEVTFLVDCSGSMRRHSETVAMLVDVLARALELAGASTEVLGFTTAAWNGGRAARDWRKAGRPAHPGRLNELRHLVLKSADVPWRTGRRGLAALLKEDLYREGVDGEAVAWACARIAGRRQAADEVSVPVLVVVSDGSPMDTATRLANGPHYLDDHLREVVASAEGPVRVLGLGVGLSLGAYYRHSRVLDLDADRSNRIFDEAIALLVSSR